MCCKLSSTLRHTPHLPLPVSLAIRCSYVSAFLPIERRWRWCEPFLSLAHKIFPCGPFLSFFPHPLCEWEGVCRNRGRRIKRWKEPTPWMTMWRPPSQEDTLLHTCEINLPYLSSWDSLFVPAASIIFTNTLIFSESLLYVRHINISLILTNRMI